MTGATDRLSGLEVRLLCEAYERLRLLPATPESRRFVAEFERRVREAGCLESREFRYVWSRSERSVVRLPLVKRKAVKSPQGVLYIQDEWLRTPRRSAVSRNARVRFTHEYLDWS